MKKLKKKLFKSKKTLKLDKTKSCNLSWPYCVNDKYFENDPEITFYTTLSKQKIGEYIDNYFFESFKKMKKEKKQVNENGIYIIQKEDESNRYNIAIERRPHYCTHASNQININKEKKEVKKMIIIQRKDNIQIEKEDKYKDKEKENNEKNKIIYMLFGKKKILIINIIH